MRDLFITVIVLGAVPLVFVRPYIGTLLWIWLSLMTPHRFTWGFAYDFSFVEVIAIVTLASLIFSPDKKSFPVTKTTVILTIFILWTGVTTLTSMSRDISIPQLLFVLKVFALAYAVWFTINTRERIHACVWVVVMSIVFYGIKGGIFAVSTGGNFLVYGPPGSFLSGNNAVGLAMTLVFPLIIYLYLNTSVLWIRWGLAGAALLSLLCVLTTFSRGAFLGLLLMIFYLILKTRRKALFSTIAALFCVFALMFMPEHWSSRIASIGDYAEDASARGRLDVWGFAWEVALDNPIFGAGFGVFNNRAAFRLYAPDIKPLEAHSIIFHVLGEHGFIGLFLFLMLFASVWFNAGWIRRQTRGRLDFRWAYDLASMVQVCLVGYLGAGLFLNKTYFDLIYVVTAILVVTGVLVAKAVAVDAAVSAVDSVPINGIGPKAAQLPQGNSAD
jgi:probable O-glycosylation ligase (exosortase A-associated)